MQDFQKQKDPLLYRFSSKIFICFLESNDWHLSHSNNL